MLLIPKEVDSERFWVLINKVDDIVHLLINLDRENRPENLLLHNWRIIFGVQNHCGLNMPVCSVSFASKDNFTTGSGHQLCQSLKVEIVNDFTLLVGALRVLTPKSVNGYLHELNESIDLAFVDENIIRCNTSLA